MKKLSSPKKGSFIQKKKKKERNKMEKKCGGMNKHEEGCFPEIFNFLPIIDAQEEKDSFIDRSFPSLNAVLLSVYVSRNINVMMFMYIYI